MNANWIKPFTTLCVGAGLGFLGGHGQPFRKLVGTEEASAARTETRLRPDRQNPLENSADRRSPVRTAGSGTGGSGNQNLVLFYDALTSSQLHEEARKLQSRNLAECQTETLLLYARWAEMDPLDAMAHARSLGAAGESARRAALESWAGYAPEAAAKYFAAHSVDFLTSPGSVAGGEPAAGRDLAAALLARSWARQDPDAAFLWASTTGQGGSRAMIAALGETARTNPALAAELAGSIDGNDRTKAYAEIATRWGTLDFRQAEKWIQGLPADHQGAIMAKAIAGLSIRDPQAAARHLDAMDAGTTRDLAVPELIRNWVGKDSSAAIDWLTSQPDEQARRYGMPYLVSVLTVQDSAGALDFVKSLPKGRVQDAGMAAYIRSDTSTSPPDLLHLTEGITDDADRGQSIAVIVSRWQIEDAAAASDYMRKISRVD